MNTSEKPTAPVDLDAPTSSGSRCNQPTRNDEKGNTIMARLTDSYIAETAEEVQAQRELMRREDDLLNARLAARGIELPAGATTDGWHSVRHDDGDAIRSLLWAEFDTSTVGSSVEVAGFQDEHGNFSRYIALYADNPELTADEARELAGALNDAASKLNDLDGLVG